MNREMRKAKEASAERFRNALEAIRQVGGDCSVVPEVTLDRLEDLRDDIQSSIDALREDLQRQQKEQEQP